MRPVLDRRFDLQGNEIARLVKLYFFHKIIPVGNLRGGPGLRCLVILCVLHYLGRPLYFARARYGDKLSIARKIVSRLRRC
jgi:hypothetical protein